MCRKIINYFQLRKKQKIAENELVDEIIKSMTETPEKWSYDGYNAIRGNLFIWVSNSPYSDMTINDRRLPRRGELRKAWAICLMKSC